MRKSERLSMSGIILNTVLFVLKIIVGFISNSSALISDAVNSFTDIFASVCIFISVKVSNKKADVDHPFGHDRAEPIAALIVAIFTSILAFEIAKSAFFNLFGAKTITNFSAAIVVLLFTIVTKGIMAYIFLKIKDRPALIATGIDSRNDVIVSSIALTGVAGSLYGYSRFDDIAALIISVFIFYSGYKIGVENINYLMGKSPALSFIQKVKRIALDTKGVKGINEIKAHFVGNKIHIEVHIEVQQQCSTKKSHDIGKAVQSKIERLHDVSKAFIHIDPV